MNTRRFATIEELYLAVKDGKIREEDLMVTLDNDCTSFGECSCVGDCSCPDDDIVVDETNGYYDIEPLYKLLFPKATVNWC